MACCEDELWDLVKSIEPAKSQKEGASRSHNYLRNVLDSGNMASRILDSYLSGSYSRDTAIHPIDDVDIIFIIDPKPWLSSLESLLSIHPSPEAVLKTFERAIRYRYPDSSIRFQRRSVRLRLYHLNIDVVPGIIEDDDKKTIRIPDTESDSWILTAPKRHQDLATNVNLAQKGMFKPLVKLLKYWNSNLPSTATFKSFTIETMAVRLFQNVRFHSLEEGLFRFYDFVANLPQDFLLSFSETYGISFNWLECVVPDVAGTGSNTAAGIDESCKEKFVQQAIYSRNKLFEAQKATSVLTACKLVNQALRV